MVAQPLSDAPLAVLAVSHAILHTTPLGGDEWKREAPIKIYLSKGRHNTPRTLSLTDTDPESERDKFLGESEDHL